MPERDAAAIHVQSLAWDFAERADAIEVLASELRRFCRRAASEHLRRERFVDLNQLSVLQPQSAALLGACDGIHRPESHPLRLASGIRILHESPYRGEPRPA